MGLKNNHKPLFCTVYVNMEVFRLQTIFISCNIHKNIFSLSVVLVQISISLNIYIVLITFPLQPLSGTVPDENSARCRVFFFHYEDILQLSTRVKLREEKGRVKVVAFGSFEYCSISWLGKEKQKFWLRSRYFLNS